VIRIKFRFIRRLVSRTRFRDLPLPTLTDGLLAEAPAPTVTRKQVSKYRNLLLLSLLLFLLLFMMRMIAVGATVASHN
jgi:hypothetical protein